MNKKERIKKVKNLLKKSGIHQKRLFFEEINEKWLEPLSSDGYFKSIPELKDDRTPRNLCWPEGNYLLRVVNLKISLVRNILEEIDTKDIENPEAKRIYMEIVLEILKNDSSATDLLDRIIDEKWITGNQLWILGYYPVKEILSLIVEGIEYNRLNELLVEIFETRIFAAEIKGDDQKSKEDTTHAKEVKQKIVTNMNDSYLVIETFKKLSFWNRDVEVLKTLLNILSQYIFQRKVVNNEDPEDLVDFSWLEWQDLTNGKEEMYWDFEDALISCIRNIIDNYLQEDVFLEIDTLFADIVKEYDLFGRFKLYIIYGQLSSYDQDFIDSVVEAYLWNRGSFREFLIFTHNSFPSWSENRKLWFESEMEEKLCDDKLCYFAQHLLLSVRNDLNPEFIKKHSSFFESHEEWLPEVHKMELKKIIDIPPFSLEKIKDMSLPKIIEQINNFKEEPLAEFEDKPTTTAFAKLLKEDFVTNPAKYLGSFVEILNSKDGLIFINHIYTSIPKIVEEEFDWEILLKELLSIIRQIFRKSEEFDEKDIRGFLFNLTNALEHKVGSISEKNHDTIFLILREILDNYSDSNLTDSEEDIDYYSISINTVIGTIYNILLWMLIETKENESFTNKIADYLEDTLESRGNPILYCMFGFYYPLASNKYEDLMNKVKEKGFLSDVPQTFRATWEGYLARNVVYSDIFKNSLDLYNYALGNKEAFTTKERHNADSIKRLLEHFSLAFLYPTFGEEAVEIFNNMFFEEITLNEKEHVIDFIGREILFRKEGNEVNPTRVINFWKDLLEKESEISLLEAFGGWINPESFPENEEVLISLLLKTLQKTSGVLQETYRLLEHLEKLIGFKDIDLLECLSLLVNSAQEPLFFISHDQELLGKILNRIQKNGGEEGLKVLEIREALVEKGYDNFGE